MNHLVSKELEVDLECGGTTSEDENTKLFISSKIPTIKTFNGVWSGIIKSDESDKSESNISRCSSTSKLGDLEHDNLEPLIIDNVDRRDHKSCVEQKRKKTSSRKPPKPPRPPNGPLLSGVDLKLAREIAEHAMRKRARIERMKALKKMKASRVSSSSFSSSSTLYAMIVTVLFCLVIITQGCLSRSRLRVGLDGSPAPAVVSNEALISVQFYKSFSPNGRDGQGPNSFNLVSGFGRRKFHGQMKR